MVRAICSLRSQYRTDWCRNSGERPRGTPSFLEELAQTVVEQGAQHATLVMPETVQAVLAARLTACLPRRRPLLQVAAVLGTTVPGALLQARHGPGLTPPSASASPASRRRNSSMKRAPCPSWYTPLSTR